MGFLEHIQSTFHRFLLSEKIMKAHMIHPITFLLEFSFSDWFRMEKLIPLHQYSVDSWGRDFCDIRNELNGDRFIDCGKRSDHREFILKPALLTFIAHTLPMIFIIVLQAVWQNLQIKIFISAMFYLR